MICKRCGSEVTYSKGWACSARPNLTCKGYTGERSYKVSTPKTTKEKKVHTETNTKTNIDTLIESYTYARLTGSSQPLDHLDTQAEKIIKASGLVDTFEELFTNDEYEAKLRYIRNAKPNYEG